MKSLIHRFQLGAALMLVTLFSVRQAQGQVSVLLSQGAIPSTTLGAAMTGGASNNPVIMVVASNTGLIVGQFGLVDQEVVQFVTIPTTPTTNTPITVRRGQMGTVANSHPNSSTLYYGPGYQFQSTDPPLGSCGSSTTSFVPQSTPWFNAKTGTVWTCDASVWHNVSDSYLPATPSSCTWSASGNLVAQTNYGTTGNTGYGLMPSGASNATVMQVSTTATGTNTHTYVCTIPIPLRANTTRGVYLMDATAAYGVQQNALGTQAATLASGTFNGTTVFSSITLPASGASETASTVTPVRADAGTMVITPVAASFNTATTTAGAFYTAKFAPATPIGLTSDLTIYQFAMTLQGAATTATTTNVPLVLFHYRYLSEGRVAR